MPIPAQSMTIPSGTMVVSIPAGALAPGFPPSPIQMPVNFPAQTVKTPAENLSIPEQNIVSFPQACMTPAGSSW
jgi:hypothetical protein